MAAARHTRSRRKSKRLRNKTPRTTAGTWASVRTAPRSAMLSQLVAGAALATAGSLVFTSVASYELPSKDVPAVVENVTLTANSSVLNIPLNLLIDLVNAPNNELQALNLFGTALMYSGPWLVTDAANIWGTDPGDYARFVAAVSMALPFPALTGINDYLNGSAANDPVAATTSRGLAVQFANLLAAELPVSEDCDASHCVPNTPVSPITGVAGIDQSLWNLAMLTGMVKFPMLSGFGKADFSGDGYSFGDVSAPSGAVHNGLGLIGTHGEDNLMPWSGTTFSPSISAALDGYLEHLMAPVSENEITLPSLTQIGRTLQTLLAGAVIAYDPFTPGSPLCPGFCVYMVKEGNTAAQNTGFGEIVQAIDKLWPGNTTIESWLADLENGTANVPTQADINTNAALFSKAYFNIWSFSNPTLPDSALNYGSNPSDGVQNWWNLFSALGLNPDPTAAQYESGEFVKNPAAAHNEGTDDPDSQYAGLTGGVYALKGTQIPLLLILEGDYYNRQQAAAYVGATDSTTNTDLTNVDNVSWWEPADWVGPTVLTQAIGDDPTPTIFGYSKGAYIASIWKSEFNEKHSGATEGSLSQNPKFVLIGNPERPNGGLSPRLNWISPTSVATPTQTAGASGVTTADYAYQYDPVSDAPTNLFNIIADLNAIMGVANHLSYGNTDTVPANAVSQGTYGDTEYFLIPSTTMPILSPVSWIPVGTSTMSAILDPIARVLVESGYDRSISPGVVTTSNPFYAPDPAKFSQDLALAIRTSLDNLSEALGGTRTYGTSSTTVAEDGQTAYGVGGNKVTPVSTDQTTGAVTSTPNSSTSTSSAADTAVAEVEEVSARTSTATSDSTPAAAEAPAASDAETPAEPTGTTTPSTTESSAAESPESPAAEESEESEAPETASETSSATTPDSAETPSGSSTSATEAGTSGTAGTGSSGTTTSSSSESADGAAGSDDTGSSSTASTKSESSGKSKRSDKTGDAAGDAKKSDSTDRKSAGTKGSDSGSTDQSSAKSSSAAPGSTAKSSAEKSGGSQRGAGSDNNKRSDKDSGSSGSE